MNYFTPLALILAVSSPVLAADLPYGTLERAQYNFPSGEYNDPIRDPYPEGQYPIGYLHPGMYCAAGNWHSGFLMPWENAPIIKPTCGRLIPRFYQADPETGYIEHPRDERAGFVSQHQRGNYFTTDSAQPGAFAVPGGTVLPGAAQDPGCGGGVGQYPCPDPKFIPNPPARY